jgi:hypothetical protein
MSAIKSRFSPQFCNRAVRTEEEHRQDYAFLGFPAGRMAQQASDDGGKGLKKGRARRAR